MCTCARLLWNARNIKNVHLMDIAHKCFTLEIRSIEKTKKKKTNVPLVCLFSTLWISMRYPYKPMRFIDFASGVSKLDLFCRENWRRGSYFLFRLSRTQRRADWRVYLIQYRIFNILLRRFIRTAAGGIPACRVVPIKTALKSFTSIEHLEPAPGYAIESRSIR